MSATTAKTALAALIARTHERVARIEARLADGLVRPGGQMEAIAREALADLHDVVIDTAPAPRLRAPRRAEWTMETRRAA